MKIRIFGCCGAGKTYIADKINEKFNIKHVDMDKIYWNYDIYPYKQNDLDYVEKTLNNILTQNEWCVEGAYINWGLNSFRKADCVFIIKKSKFRCRLNVFLRYLKKKIKLDKGNKENFKDLKDLFNLIRVFDKKVELVIDMLTKNNIKFYYIKNCKQALNILRQSLNDKR